ncbi:oxidoreductase-like protein [Absidia repens]|uniref:Oxidoreductase-like protein n=1 Tax=Absidia repens TaxID=90262 RepID=A0A1X2IR55_9FUNG|nr:oxidoreductase-like protein [Absidia repens]
MLLFTTPLIKRACVSRRFYHHSSRYDGYWTLLLQQQKTEHGDPALPVNDDDNNDWPSLDTTNNDRQVTSTATPIENAPASTEISNEDSVTSRQSQFVWLQNEKIPLPEKPPPPENCCMSGCAYCVYDIYQEDMESYKHDMSALRQRFANADQDLPEALQTKKKTSPQSNSGTENDDDDDDDDMDPTMKAFLEMEKKLNAKS